MDFFAALKARRSVRHFTSAEVPDEILASMARAALQAPSINDEAMISTIAIKDKAVIEEMAQMVGEAVDALGIEDERVAKSVAHFLDFFLAPLLRSYSSSAVPTRRWWSAGLGEDLSAADVNAMRGRPDLLSVGGAVQSALLAATALDYQTCWLSAPLVAREELEAIVGVEEHQQIAALVAVGKGAKQPQERAEPALEGRFRLVK